MELEAAAANEATGEGLFDGHHDRDYYGHSEEGYS
jgi:hypothetical protein